MNCHTVDTILDDRKVADLDPVVRQSVDQHLHGCVRCADSWAAHIALAADVIHDAPPALLARVRSGLVRPQGREAKHRSMRSAALVVAAAAAVAIAVIAVYSPETQDGAEGGRAALKIGAEALPEPNQFRAGVHYLTLRRADEIGPSTGPVEVTEFFMYHCWPCYAFETEFDRWQASAGGDVRVARVPALFGAAAELHARAFYMAAALGKLDAMHETFFLELHERGNALDSRDALAVLFERFGVDAKTFADTFDSPAIDSQIETARALASSYGIRATPSLVVAGRYATDAGRVDSWAQLVAVVDHLVTESKRPSTLATP